MLQNLEIIDRRDETILNALAKPRPLADICSMGLIYGKKFLIAEWVRVGDAQAIKNISITLSQEA
jgi:hypothetical protein